MTRCPISSIPDCGIARNLFKTRSKDAAPSKCPGCLWRPKKRLAAISEGQEQCTSTTPPASSASHSVRVPESGGIPGTCQNDTRIAPDDARPPGLEKGIALATQPATPGCVPDAARNEQLLQDVVFIDYR